MLLRNALSGQCAAIYTHWIYTFHFDAVISSPSAQDFILTPSYRLRVAQEVFLTPSYCLRVAQEVILTPSYRLRVCRISFWHRHNVFEWRRKSFWCRHKPIHPLLSKSIGSIAVLFVLRGFGDLSGRLRAVPFSFCWGSWSVGRRGRWVLGWFSPVLFFVLSEAFAEFFVNVFQFAA